MKYGFVGSFAAFIFINTFFNYKVDDGLYKVSNRYFKIIRLFLHLHS